MHWEPAPLNEWEAGGLPEPWWDEFSLPLTAALPPKQQRRAEYRQIENLTP
jgi:hypothetical protein